MEISCDESGSEGEKLIGGNTDVFTHASLCLDVESAASCIRGIRDRAPSPAVEYKANVLLREKNRPALTWLLGPSGPIHGKAHVHLTDKTFLVIGRLTGLLAGESGPETIAETTAETAHAPDMGLRRDLRQDRRDRQIGAMAATLYREGLRTFGHERWRAFLESSNDLMRTGNGRSTGNGQGAGNGQGTGNGRDTGSGQGTENGREAGNGHGTENGRDSESNRDTGSGRSAEASADTFFDMVEGLRLAGAGSEVGEIMELFRRARPRVDSFLARLLDDPRTVPSLDPLIPAIVRAVAYWGGGTRPVSIVHDRQTTLTEERVARIREMLGEPRPDGLPWSPTARLSGLRFVASYADARIQVADLLAGAARKIASDELNGRGDAELTALLRPYVDASSIWGDDRSWSLLESASGIRP
ncbi:hypothetical protein [Streptosporangium vulgare]|uniref:DUF3800 domain-containing protein n=1 Tax=Streptosporangium vulgare TaxID=46190 RepID=A0ABV5TKY2_9ACTN